MKNILNSLDDSTKKMIKIALIVVAVVIFLFIALFIYKLIVGEKVSYENLETIISKAAEKYSDNSDDFTKPEEGDTKKILTSDLINGKYMREFEKYTKDTGCNGTVYVANNGGQYLYNTILECDNYKTKTISDAITSNVVSEGDGLYADDTGYLYKGEYVNNYIKIDDNIYRILSVDNDGYVKVYRFDKSDSNNYSWDDRYNSIKDDNTGINIYDKSRLKENLHAIYSDFDDSTKKYISYHEWCIGPRSIDDGSKSAVECSDTTNEYIGTFIPEELINQSLDEKCDSVFSVNCQNYNYLFNEITYKVWTMTAIKEDNYESFYYHYSVNYGYNSSTFVLPRMFYISGFNKLMSGTGSESDPFVIM